MSILRIFLIILTLCVTACGGGESSSGSDVDFSDVRNISPTAPRVGAEFIAEDCISSMPVSGALVRTSILVTNSCGQDVNIRLISGDAFDRVYLIPGSSTQTIDEIRSSFAACFAPYIPGGVANQVQYQCLG